MAGLRSGPSGRFRSMLKTGGTPPDASAAVRDRLRCLQAMMLSPLSALFPAARSGSIHSRLSPQPPGERMDGHAPLSPVLPGKPRLTSSPSLCDLQRRLFPERVPSARPSLSLQRGPPFRVLSDSASCAHKSSPAFSRGIMGPGTARNASAEGKDTLRRLRRGGAPGFRPASLSLQRVRRRK